MAKYEVLYDFKPAADQDTIKGGEGNTVEMTEEEAAPYVARGILAKPKVLKEQAKAEETARKAEEEARKARQEAAAAEAKRREEQAEAQAAADAVDNDSRASEAQTQVKPARKRSR